MIGQDPVQIPGDPSAGDVGQRVEIIALDQFLDDGQIVTVRGQQLLTHRLAQLLQVAVDGEFFLFEEEFSNQGISVGVKSRGGKTDQDVPLLDLTPFPDLGFIGQTHDKPHQVVFSDLIKNGHLGRLSTQKSTLGLATALG